MKVKELIKKLGQFDGGLEIKVNTKYTDHYNCGAQDGGYCYCSTLDHIECPDDPILVKDMSIYDGKYHENSKYKEAAVVLNVG